MRHFEWHELLTSLDLEVSKPQKNRNPLQNQGRRSRSPDYGRGLKPAPGTDRYVSGNRWDYGRDGRGHNYRSPSPPRGGYGRQRYDDRDYRTRSPDYGRRGGYGRSLSPRRNEDDDLPLPRRQPHEIPEVQIIVLDSLDRDFISWVQQGFSSGRVRVDVLLLSPRLDERAVIRRQIVEGVLAVVKLTRANQQTGKIGMQIFDRSRGAGNVQFNEYDGLDPSVCAALVQQAKSAASAAPTPSYGGGRYGGQQPHYGAPPPPQQGYGGGYSQPPPQYGHVPPGYPPAQYGAPQSAPPPGQQQPNLQHLITSLDPNGLQNLLSAMGTGQSPATPQTGSTSYGATPLSGYPPGGQQQQPQLAAMLQQQQTGGAPASAAGHAPGGGGQVNMQDILARLGSGYRP
jgi:nuclear polyadenylated RNA-binding protein 3